MAGRKLEFPCKAEGCLGLVSKWSKNGLCRVCMARTSSDRFIARHGKDKYLGVVAEWRKNNRDSIRQKHKEWRDKNRNTLRDCNRKYSRDKREKDLNYRLSGNIRSRLGDALRKAHVPRGKLSAVSDMGCSVEFLIQHLESLFEEGMNWDNYGGNGWTVDHVVPLSAWNLADESQFLAACNYRNLRPMWGSKNNSKNDRLTDEALSKFDELQKIFNLPKVVVSKEIEDGKRLDDVLGS